MATNPSVATRTDDDEHPAVRALENAPLADPDDFTPEEIAHLEGLSREAAAPGSGKSTAEVLEMLAEQGKHRRE